MMGPRTSSDRAIITAFSLAIVLVISLSAALITFAAHSINQEEMAREQTLASHAVATSLTEMAAQAETAASWDEAFANLGDSINQTWADRSLLAYYHTSFGHDLTLVFTPELKLGYVGRDGTRVNPIRYEGLAQSIKPTVAKAQAFELRRRRGLEKPGPAGLGDAVIDSLTVRDGDSIFQLGIATIEPTNGTAPGARPAALVVTGRRVDQRLLNGLHDSLGISGARFQTEPAPAGDAFIPVNDRNGRPLTFIVWPPLRPGLSAMAHEGGVSLAAGGLLALAMGALGWRIRKLLQDGREKDQALQSTLIDLEAARRRAEAASASKSAFLANMSHEIRTPLNGVLGMAQIMELGELAPHQRERVNVIVRSGKALLQILNDILDLSKIEAEMFELTYEDFRFLQVLENVELTFADIAAAKGIELKVIAGSDLDLILHGDPVRLRQILLNLVSNAVKFTPKGKVTLLAERNGGEILCHIIDDGAGISAEDLPLLFKKFSPARRSAQSAGRRHGAWLGDLPRLGDLDGRNDRGLQSPWRGLDVYTHITLSRSQGAIRERLGSRVLADRRSPFSSNLSGGRQPHKLPDPGSDAGAVWGGHRFCIHRRGGPWFLAYGVL